MPWTVDWSVNVNGQDISSGLRSYLIDIEVSDKAGSSSDTCSISIDNSGGAIAMPEEGSFVIVGLAGAIVFEGTVDSVRSTGSRGGGRLLKVSAKGFDSRGKVKEGQSHHKDDSTLGDFLNEAAGKAGFSITVDPELASKQRPYWAADNESFLGLGERLAREFYATFKIRGTQAVFIKRGNDMLGSVSGLVGVNVISWDIAPFTGRHSFTKAKLSWFDRPSASFKEKEVSFDSSRPLPDSAHVVRSHAADESQAGDIGEGRKGEAEREGGEGSVELDLMPEAQAEGLFSLSGAGPGVDGTYRIETVKHKASRDGGATTSLDLKQPKTN